MGIETLAANRQLAARSWADRIAASWQKSLQGLIACGQLLREARAALRHGEFQRMIENDLPFGPRTAQRFMALAAHPCITNATFASHLPAHWDTLGELAKLSDSTFAERVADGTIHPDMTKREAAALRERVRAVRDQLDLFSPREFLLSSTGRTLEKAMCRHAYAQVKLTKDCELIIGLVVTSIRELERLASELSPPSGLEKIEAELNRLEDRVHRLMGPCRIPAAKRERPASQERRS
jgi:hypothetical protein